MASNNTRAELIRTIGNLYALPEFEIKALEQFDEKQLFVIGALLNAAYRKGNQDAEIQPTLTREIHARITE